MILDITFYEENQLVDQEFPEDSSPFKIQQLLQDLTEPEVLVARLAPGQEVCMFLWTVLFQSLLFKYSLRDFSLKNSEYRHTKEKDIPPLPSKSQYIHQGFLLCFSSVNWWKFFSTYSMLLISFCTFLPDMGVSGVWFVYIVVYHHETVLLVYFGI